MSGVRCALQNGNPGTMTLFPGRCFLAVDLPGEGQVNARMVPAVENMAYAVHKRPFARIGDAYTALIKWVDANGYRLCGAGREICLHFEFNKLGVIIYPSSEAKWTHLPLKKKNIPIQ